METGLCPLFCALADPTRLRLLQTLVAAESPDSALCVGALARRLGISQPAVSQHLRVLRNLGLVRAERRGLRVHYVIDAARLSEVQASVQAFLDTLTSQPQAADGCNHCAHDAACVSSQVLPM